MSDVTVRAACAEDLPRLRAFLARYRAVYADAKLMPPELYLYHPAAAGGANVALAFGGGGAAEEDDVVGFAPLFPAPVAAAAPPELPHQLWTIVLPDPTAGGLDADAVREALLAWVLARAEALAADFPQAPARGVRLGADMMVSQAADVAFLAAHGFAPFERIYVMRRLTAAAVPERPLPAGVTLRRTPLTAEAEQAAYLAALNACFPQDPRTAEGLRFLLGSPAWAQATAVTVVDAAGNLVGSVLAYPAQSGRTGLVDDVFVLPAWRGQGLAKALVADALRFLAEGGFWAVGLEVRATNAPALRVYTAMGFEIVNEEVLLSRRLA